MSDVQCPHCGCHQLQTCQCPDDYPSKDCVIPGCCYNRVPKPEFPPTCVLEPEDRLTLREAGFPSPERIAVSRKVREILRSGDQLQSERDSLGDAFAKANDENMTLRADVVRLREALRVAHDWMTAALFHHPEMNPRDVLATGAALSHAPAAAKCPVCGRESCEGTHVCTCNSYPHKPDCGRTKNAAEQLDALLNEAGLRAYVHKPGCGMRDCDCAPCLPHGHANCGLCADARSSVVNDGVPNCDFGPREVTQKELDQKQGVVRHKTRGGRGALGQQVDKHSPHKKGRR